jgi:glutamate--cysteine ligase
MTYAQQTVLNSSAVGTVGIETEWFVVDLATPRRPVPPERTLVALDRLPGWTDGAGSAGSAGGGAAGAGGGAGTRVLPGGSRVSFEPGGQLELSGPPQPLAAAVRASACDLALARTALAEAGLALASMGVDPLRPPNRVVATPRYAAMERYFCTSGYLAGPVMMCSTAAVQVNLDAGAPHQWSDRAWLAQALGPVLTAMFAASPAMAGRRTGWMSTRRAVWADIDPSRTRPVLPLARPSAAPADAAGLWAQFLLGARVMLVREADGRCHPADGRRTFADWVAGRADGGLPGRPPTMDDLSYHATTLFPPVRPRGWLELRYLDGQPAGLWPVLVAVVVGLLDDPAAAERAADVCAPTADRWTAAALMALRDPILHKAALELMPLARAGAARLGAGADLLAALDAFAGSYVEPGRSPADDLSRRLTELGPTGLLRQEAISCPTIPS